MTGTEEINEPKVALFIDIQNGAGLDMQLVLKTASLLGRIEVAKGFAPFGQGNPGVERQARKLSRMDVELIHCPPMSADDREVDDRTMQEQIRQTLELRPKIERFVLCTGDGDFVREVRHIRAKERVAFVIAPPGSISRELAAAATVCLTTPVWGQGNGHQRTAQRPKVQDQQAGKNGSHWWESRVKGLPPITRPNLS